MTDAVSEPLSFTTSTPDEFPTSELPDSAARADARGFNGVPAVGGASALTGATAAAPTSSADSAASEGLETCQRAIDYRFRDLDLLRVALTHASVAATRQTSNERLEFLGDAVLGMVVCQDLFESYPQYLEGELTKIKSAVVSRRTCAEVAQGLGVQEALLIGKGVSNRSQLPPSLAAAVLESLIGAMYIDGGLEVARTFILRCMRPFIEENVRSEHQQNFKSQLQQHAQKVLGCTPIYEVLDEKGPDHSKCFEIAVTIDGRQFPSAWGRSKKEAEQRAAQSALIELKVLAEEVEAA